MISGKPLTAAFFAAALTAASANGASADSTSVQSPASSTAASQPRLTFPPKSNCDFLGGSAQQSCEAREAGQSSEISKVQSGEIKTLPPAVQSSGGVYTPLSNQGSLGGFGESSTIPDSEPPRASPPYTPNSIGNPWAGTPFANGTGIHSHY